MKDLSRLAGVVLLMGCAWCASAADPKVGKFTRYDAGEFVIVTSRSEAQARKIVEDLGKFRLTLERALGKRAAQNAFPTNIVISGATDWSSWLQPGQDIAGYFHRGRFSNYLALNGDERAEGAFHIVLHEYTHYYLASQFSGEYPPWFNEGLAELMGYAKFNKSKVTLQVPQDRLSQARYGEWIPFDRLIQVDQSDPEYQSHKLAASFYAESWLAVHYGMVDNRDFGARIVQYLNDLNHLVPQLEAAHKNFGDLVVADDVLHNYARLGRISLGTMDLGETPAVTLSQGKPLDDSETLAILADLMLEARMAPDRIRPLIESLGQRDSNPARAAILAARLARLEDDNAAFDAAVSKAESSLAPDDWQQRRELAMVLLNSALESNPMSSRKSKDTDRDLKRSANWFAEAINHNNQDVESLWGYGTAATRLGQNLGLAEQALVGAYQRAPASADIAVSLAELKNRQQKPDEAIPYLQDAIRNASDLEMRRWATVTLERTREYVTERRRVEADSKKK